MGGGVYTYFKSSNRMKYLDSFKCYNILTDLGVDGVGGWGCGWAWVYGVPYASTHVHACMHAHTHAHAC